MEQERINFDEVRHELTEEMNQLLWEIEMLRIVFESEHIDLDQSLFPNAHYGYIMTCFSRLDLLSLYWCPTEQQTKRMRNFMGRYLYPGKTEEVKVAVQLWRHTLMHVGQPMPVRDKRTGRTYYYLMGFGNWTSTDQHFTLVDFMGRKSLQISVCRLANDLQRGLEQYLKDLEANTVDAQAKYIHATGLVSRQEFW